MPGKYRVGRLPVADGQRYYAGAMLLLLGSASRRLAHIARHDQAGLVGRDGNQLVVGVGLDDLDHVRVGVTTVTVANFGHLTQQVLVVLTSDNRVELLLVAFTVLAVAFQALLFVQFLTLGDLHGCIGTFVLAVFDRDAQAFDVGSDVGQFLSIGQGGGERVHGWVVAQTGTDVGHLLDQHSGVLTGELREGAIRTAGAGGQVAGTADFITFGASFLVALLGQGLGLFATLGIPLVSLAFNALLVWGRGGGKSDASGEQANQQKRCFHV